MHFVRKDGTPTEFIIVPARANGETIYFEVLDLLHGNGTTKLEDGRDTFARLLIQKVYLKED